MLHDIMMCEETASERLPYARSVPNIVQISAFLNSKDGLLKCVRLRVLSFQVYPFGRGTMVTSESF